MNKYLPEYLNSIDDGIKTLCEKIDLVLEAIYGSEADRAIEEEQAAAALTADNNEQTPEDNADDTETPTPKKRGRKPKKWTHSRKGSPAEVLSDY